MDYQIKGRETVYAGHIFSIDRVEIDFPDHHTRKYDCVEIQNAVTIFPLDDEGNVLFVKQFRVGSNSSMLELPAGKIESGEEPLATAEREIREETGMAAREMIPMGKFFMSPGYSTEFMFTFFARGLYPAPLDPDADEFLNVVKVPLPRALQMIQSGEIEDGKTLATFIYMLPHLKTDK